jgi:hypothetical protein
MWHAWRGLLVLDRRAAVHGPSGGRATHWGAERVWCVQRRTLAKQPIRTMYRARGRSYSDGLVYLHGPSVVLVRCLLALLAFVELSIALLCLSLVVFFLLGSGLFQQLRFEYLSFARITFAHVSLPLRVCLLRRRHVWMLPLKCLRNAR